MAKPSLSAIVIAKNEAEQLPGCLKALAWVDEIVVVVDAASRDATHQIARASAHRVLIRAFDTFAAQRNAGHAIASGDWIFAVDADERATPALAHEIRTQLDNSTPPCTGYRVPIRSRLFGREFRFSGTQLDRPIRLFQRAAGRWHGEVHETVKLAGSVGTLSQHLNHTTHETLREFLSKLNHYTDLEARGLRLAGKKPRTFDLTLRPLYTFLRLYFARLGVLDGRAGLLFCGLSAVSTAVTYAKLRELCEGRVDQDAAVADFPELRGAA